LDNFVFFSGNGSRGQMGTQDIEIKCETPRRIEFFDDLPCTVIDVVTGGWHSLALTSDGDIYSWGWNQASQCGHSSDSLSTVVRLPYPVDLGSGDNPVTGIAAGARHSVALLRNGEVFSWGWNKYGQLGLGHNEDKPVPTQVTCAQFDSHKPARVVAGRWGTLVICTLLE
jgi:alpha-tubulin suppressor-like RCC1 family protein